MHVYSDLASGLKGNYGRDVLIACAKQPLRSC